MTAEGPVFVVGAPRSGTTLLQLLISSHSGFMTFPETQLFTHVLPRLENGERLRTNGFAPLFTTLEQKKPNIRFTEPARHAVAQYLAKEDRIGPREILGAIVHGFTVQDGRSARRWVEKTPRHVNHLTEIHEEWPDAKVVHIFRDPRDVVSSFHSRRAFPGRIARYEDLFRRIEQYRGCIRSRSAYRDARVTDVRYEDLVRQPELEMGRIMSFLGEEFEPAQISTFSTSFEAATAGETHKDLCKAGEIVNRREVWRDRLTPAETWWLERRCREEMELLGYPAAGVSPALTVRAGVRCLAVAQTGSARLSSAVRIRRRMGRLTGGATWLRSRSGNGEHGRS